MEKNIADQLNKAFEAYRTASIERDNAKKELKQKVAKMNFQFFQKSIEVYKAFLPQSCTNAGKYNKKSHFCRLSIMKESHRSSNNR